MGLPDVSRRGPSDHNMFLVQFISDLLALPATTLATYAKTLAYLARVPDWGAQWLRFHFQESVEKLAELEPLVNRFTQDQLRGSPLFFYSHVLDSLQRDANQQVGFSHLFFNRTVDTGLRGLNPGLARGTLSLKPEDQVSGRTQNSLKSA